MTGCGIKNSVPCRPEQTNHEHNTNKPTIHPTFPFRFVDRNTGIWSIPDTNPYERIFDCPYNSTVVFNYLKNTHDVVKLNSAAEYDQCNVSNAQTLSPSNYKLLLDASSLQNNDGGTENVTTSVLVDLPDVTYYHKCLGPINSTEYITCSIPGHCQYGQKIILRTVDVVEVTNKSIYHDHNDTMPQMQVDSLAQLLILLGSRDDPETGFLIIDRGYQTEALADQTHEWIWCALEHHCPSMAWDVWPDATMQDCTSILYLLLGFINRKRPIPKWENAEHYYRLAINDSNATNITISEVESVNNSNNHMFLTSRNECAARSYLSKLFLDKGDFKSATKEADILCYRCDGKFVIDGDSDIVRNSATIAIKQAKYEFDIMSESGWNVQWPEDGACQNIFETISPTTLPIASQDNVHSTLNSSGKSNIIYDRSPCIFTLFLLYHLTLNFF